jgi:putative hydrolase of the HAD superfamily
MIRGAFFDAAGTLFEAREPVGRTYARIAREFGVDASEEVVDSGFRRAFGTAAGLAFGLGHPASELRRLEREWWRMRVAETFAGIGAFVDFDGYFDALFEYFGNPAHWVADDEAQPMLLRLKDSGIKLGVISNFDHRLYRILDGLDLSRHFESITISSEAGYAKPRREVFESALLSAGLNAREAMHIGDSERLDFAAAIEAGMAAVLINRDRDRDRDREQALRAPVVRGRTARISSLATVIEVAREFEVA